ncbi:GNAT family N-acetyltransferase [Jannaschia sp. R86511]|uniref:GNAT family N-acetyltransferase n=1 Tax=Jannaschia sp. R86511 TaxID=3093853 RepID=UPI0036D28F8A
MTATRTWWAQTGVEVLTTGSPSLGGWVRLRADARTADGSLGPPVCGVDCLGSLAVDPPGSRAIDLLARRDGHVAGWARVIEPVDVSGPVTVESLVVDPGHRGCGVGRCLLDLVRRAAASEGRREVLVAVPEPLVSMATAWGGHDGGRPRQVHQVMHVAAQDLAVTLPHVPAGLAVVRWEAQAPDDMAAGVSALDGHRNLEMLRSLERMRRVRGRTARHTALVDEGGGRVVGYTSISLPASSPLDVEQGMTVVDPTARGRGHGWLLKSLSFAALRRERPWVRRMWTANDEENRPMSALNRRLGFRPWQYRRVLVWEV